MHTPTHAHAISPADFSRLTLKLCTRVLRGYSGTVIFFNQKFGVSGGGMSPGTLETPDFWRKKVKYIHIKFHDVPQHTCAKIQGEKSLGSEFRAFNLNQPVMLGPCFETDTSWLMMIYCYRVRTLRCEINRLMNLSIGVDQWQHRYSNILLL